MSHATPLRLDEGAPAVGAGAARACAHGLGTHEARAAAPAADAQPGPLTPLHDYLLVRLDAVRADITRAGLLVRVDRTIESQRQLGRLGVVVAVGAGCRDARGARQPLCVRVGDRVIFGEFLHCELQHAGERYLVLREADVCAVMEADHG